jgi:hypothetical protein
VGLLTLDRTNITGPGLTELKELKKLRHLLLTGSTVTDEALKYVAELLNVQHRSLSFSKVTKAGVDELRKARPKMTVNF